MTDRKRLRNLQRRVNRARNAKGVTCAASRHVHEIADTIAKYGIYFTDDTGHDAESIYAVLESLWKLRKAKP